MYKTLTISKKLRKNWGFDLKKKGKGFSFIEVILAMSFLLIVGGGALKVFSETSLPQQAMVRDYAVAMNICERFINSLNNDLLEGIVIENMQDKDVTDAILENPAIQDYLKIFAGGVGKESTSLTSNFQALLTIKPGPPPQSSIIKNVKLQFKWGSGGKEHNFQLQSYVYVR